MGSHTVKHIANKYYEIQDCNCSLNQADNSVSSFLLLLFFSSPSVCSAFVVTTGFCLGFGSCLFDCVFWFLLLFFVVDWLVDWCVCVCV